MTTHYGNDGTLYISAAQMAELRSWSLTEQASVADNSNINATWDTHMASKTTNRWSGDATAFWDDSDTNGQEALTVGASVVLNFYPAGNTAGKTYYTGTATVTQTGKAITRGQTVERTFQFTGNGALAKATA